MSDSFASVAQLVKPAVVFIQSQRVEPVNTQRGSIRLRLRVEQGSGFLASSKGYILTNNHLVAGADRVTVRLYDKREFTAHVVGTAPSTDVALIKIDSRDLPTVQFRPDSTRVGEWALAIGKPLGAGLMDGKQKPSHQTAAGPSLPRIGTAGFEPATP